MKNVKKISPFLTVKNINQRVVEAKYAVRGEIIDFKAKIAQEMKAGKKFPFDAFCELNIGNPQTFKQKPLTFLRQVLAVVAAPELLQSGPFSDDVKKRAQEYLNGFNSVGCYTDSPGNSIVTNSVASFISKRDGVKAVASNILLGNGASDSIQNIMNVICGEGKTGFMIPIPQYPLYSATAQLYGAEFVGYYLDEDNVLIK
jgi:alanine transaminase